MARSARRGGGVFADLPELETERLLLRKMRLDDAQAMFSYASDPEVTRYVLWETHPLVEDSERGEFGGWGVVLKGSGAFVGTCGVDVGYAPEHARAELGYVLSREHWGKGLVLEAVRAVIRFGFAHEPQPRGGTLHRRERCLRAC